MKQQRIILMAALVILAAAVLPAMSGCGGATAPSAPAVTKGLPPVPSSSGSSTSPGTMTSSTQTSGATPTSLPPPPAVTPRKNISVAEASALIAANQGNPEFVILDVRTPEEYAGGHIENAVNINYGAADFRDLVSQLDKGKTYLVYCRTGARSAAASDIMVSLAFTDVYNMTGGITDWQAAGYPVVP